MLKNIQLPQKYLHQYFRAKQLYKLSNILNYI